MEINSAKPAANEIASVTAAVSEQTTRFNDRKSIEAQSDVKSEAVFFSPVIKIDKETHSTVIQYRDPTTGAVTRQYPDTAKVNAYEHAQETAPASSPSSDNSGIIPVISDQKQVAQAPVQQDDSNAQQQPAVAQQASVPQQQPPVQKSQDPVVDQQV